MKTLILMILLTSCLSAQQGEQKARPQASGEAAFRKLADQYFDEVFFKFNPTQGTAAGFHQYDAQFEDLSSQTIGAQVGALHRFRTMFNKVDPGRLSPEARADRDLLIANIMGTLLALEQIRAWEKNPDIYSSSTAASAFTIMSRKFAPADVRLKSLTEREQKMPKLLDQARQNLKNPPRIYTEVALEQIPGIVGFFQKDVPDAFAEAKDPAIKQAFNNANSQLITALQKYGEYLKAEVLPHSTGDFKIGADNYRKKLLYDEMVDTPLDRLLEIGTADLRKNQEEFKRVAAEIDPNKTPRQILEELERDHPAPDQLLQSFRDTFSSLRGFIQQKRIITIPSPFLPTLEETPPFMRALTTASMDTPGPYESVAKEAYFNVTLPEANWPKEQVDDYMSGFNRGTIISTAVHETYPGHYVQFLGMKDAPSKARKLLGSGTNAEGWAHYCEQMMLDEGYGQPGMGARNDREAKMLRLGQLQDALLRNARFIVGIKMHTGQMSFDEAKEFFVNEGYQVRSVAEKEAKRGTSDPTYLVYTLGKLQIMKLREDYKKMKGDQFSLEEFHNAFMRQGFPPIKIVRQALLGNDSPTL
jgi:uncharacterized protein (DUF885 family)